MTIKATPRKSTTRQAAQASSASADLHNEVYEMLGRVALAFGSASRLRLIQILSQAPRTVEELAEFAGQTVANTSQHLQRMAKEGLVTSTRQGVSRIYRVRSPGVTALWESLQDLAQELVLPLSEAEKTLTDPELHSPKSAKDILSEVKNRKAVLLDVRLEKEAAATPIEGATVMPLDKLKSAMGELSKDKPVYVFCRGRYCALASEAVRKLRAAGFTSFRLRESPFKLAALKAAKE